MKLRQYEKSYEKRFESVESPVVYADHRYELYFRESSREQEQDYFYKRRSYGVELPLGDTSVSLLASRVRSQFNMKFKNKNNKVTLNTNKRFNNIGTRYNNRYLTMGGYLQTNNQDRSEIINPWAEVKLPGYFKVWAVRSDHYSNLNSGVTHDGSSLSVDDDYRLEKKLYGARLSSIYHLPEVIYRQQEKLITDYRSTTPTGEDHIQTVDGESEFESWEFRLNNNYNLIPVYREMDYEDFLRMNMTTTPGERIFTAFQESEWQRKDYRISMELSENSRLIPGYFTRNSSGIGSAFFEPGNFDRFFGSLFTGPLSGLASANAFYTHESDLEGYFLRHSVISESWNLKTDLEYYDYNQFLLEHESNFRFLGISLDQNAESINYNKLSIMNLRLDGSFELTRSLSANFLLRQLIPVEVDEQDDSDESGSDSVGGDSEDDVGGLFSEWGGFRADLSLTVEF